MIFDQAGAERYAMLAWKLSPQGADVEWRRSAESIDELARGVGVDPSALSATVERFNGFARSGVDEDFHRGETFWDRTWGDPSHVPNPSLGTIERGPFRAIRVYAGVLATRGGLRVNEDRSVYSAATRQPIPGLYAVGNCSNGSVAASYPGPGATLGAAVTFGYVAGMHAAHSHD